MKKKQKEIHANNIIDKIDRYFTKLALIRLKEILINETNKSYYRNLINVEKTIELDNETKSEDNGVEYTTTKNIVFWSNGFYEINNMNKFKVLSKTKE